MIKQIKVMSVVLGLLCGSTAVFAQATTTVHAPQTAADIQRVISAGGSISEWLVAIGGENKLVGVDTTSLHPARLQALPSVGYQRQLAAEGVLTLHPQIIFGSTEMGPPPVLEQLRSAGVQIETLSVDANLDAVSESVRRMGHILSRTEQAEAALTQFQNAMAQRQQQLKTAQGVQPRVVLIFSAGQGNPLTAGTNTVGDWLIKQAGGHNLAAHEGFKALSSESMLALNPQVIIVADRHNQGLEALATMLSNAPALQHTEAVKHKRVIAIDPTLLVGGLGPRIPEQVEQLISLFYPALPMQAARKD